MATIGGSVEWKCRSCEEVFTTRGKRNAHQRKLHQKFATPNNGRIQLQRSLTEKFVYKCGTCYNQAQSLSRHRRSCYSAIAMAEVGVNNSEEEEGKT